MCNIRRPDWPDAQVRQREQSKQNDRDRDYVSSSWIHERTTEGFKVASVAQMRETSVFVGFRALLKGCEWL